jgi:hypothetical protein
MDILFKNIPLRISAYELASFIESSFNGKGTNDALNISVNSIEMMEIQDNFTHPIEKFGIVRGFPSDIAKKVIKELDGCVLNQFQMTVREYFNRSTENDPRLNSIDSTDDFSEKREQDRRLFKVRDEKDRRAEARRIEQRRLEAREEQDRRINERRVQDRRKKNLIYSRRI